MDADGYRKTEFTVHRLFRRVWLAAAMTCEYQGRFPRRRIWKLYWTQAGRMVSK